MSFVTPTRPPRNYSRGISPAKRRRLNFRMSEGTQTIQGSLTSGGVVGVPRPVARIVPETFSIWLPYCQAIGNAATSVVIVGNTFRMNSIFDPDLTGVGHQPMGRDLWSGVFRWYRVSHFRAKITFINRFNSVDGFGHYVSTIVGYQTSHDTTFADTFTEAIEGKRGRDYAVLGPPQGGNNVAILTYETNLSEFKLGTVEAEGADEWTAVGSNPAWVALFRLGAATIDGDTDVFTHILVELNYLVEFRQSISSITQLEN
jgi:hypothetical protein